MWASLGIDIIDARACFSTVNASREVGAKNGLQGHVSNQEYVIICLLRPMSYFSF